MQSGNIPLLNWLFDRDSDVNEANKEEGSLFHSIDRDADESTHYEMVAFLLSKGVCMFMFLNSKAFEIRPDRQ